MSWVSLLNKLSALPSHLLTQLVAERATLLASTLGAKIEIAPQEETVGAASLSSLTIRQVLGKFSNICFLQYCHRPNDFRRNSDGLNFLSRSSVHLQMQWLIRPCLDIRETVTYLLANLGLDLDQVTFVPSQWSSTVIGAYGKGYEVRYSGVEVMQVTVFERFLGNLVEPILEVVLGVERVTFLLLRKLTKVPSYKTQDRYYYKSIYRHKKTWDHLIQSMRYMMGADWNSMLRSIHQYNLFSSNVNHNPIVRYWLHDLIRRKAIKVGVTKC